MNGISHLMLTLSSIINLNNQAIMEPPPPYSETDPSSNVEAPKPPVIIAQPTSIHGGTPPPTTGFGETEHEDRFPFRLSDAAGPSQASPTFSVEEEENKKKKEIPSNVWSVDCCFCTAADTDCMEFFVHLCICCSICDQVDPSVCDCTGCCDPSCCGGSDCCS